MIGVPQVVNRTPPSYAHFYSAPGGISFNATTLTTTNPINRNTLKLYLNGVNVAADLAITGPDTNLVASYTGLASNCYYEARIELEDALGRRTTNSWTFDTFSDAYLASPLARNIECEEYDFGDMGDGVTFFDQPIVSGYQTNYGPGVNVGLPNTYVDKVGAAGIDFFDWDTGTHADEMDFRTQDPVGTQNGSFEYQAALNGIINAVFYDTPRQKYLDAQPDGALVECGVERTEGAEWLNYTRIFYASNAYNVYLRHGCALSQTWNLQLIGAGPSTNDLGSFSCLNAFTKANFRYVPLRDASGKKSVVSLSGTNTLRLASADPRIGAVKQGMWMNYLAFVPAEPQVWSSPQADGAYSPENNMLVDTGARRITVPQSGSARFYRVTWKSPLKIRLASLAGGNVVLQYQ